MEKISIEFNLLLTDELNNPVDTILHTGWTSFVDDYDDALDVAQNLKQLLYYHLKKKTINISNCHCCIEKPQK